MNNTRILGYDLTRSFCVIFVFIAHVVLAQTQNSYLFAFYTSISPGITMSLLGFISACLLVNGKDAFSKYPIFLFRRLTRILIPVFLVLTFALILVSIYGLSVNKEHLIYHYLGLSLFLIGLEYPTKLLSDGDYGLSQQFYLCIYCYQLSIFYLLIKTDYYILLYIVLFVLYYIFTYSHQKHHFGMLLHPLVAVYM